MAGVLAVLPTADSADSEATKAYSKASWPGEYVEPQIPNPTATGSVLTDQQIQAATADLFQTVGVTSPPAEAPAEPTAVEPEVEAASAQYPTAVVAGCPALIVEAFGVNAPAACSVAWCESRWDANATGAAGERGWFQIHPYWHYDSTYDPAGNVMAAYRISSGGSDWSAWTCKPW